MTRKIFVIGFNRCGTTALHRLFERSGLRSVHFRAAQDRPSLPAVLAANFSAGRPLLTGIGDFDAYGDLGVNAGQMMFEGARLFRQLHAEHPDAYFLLNTRPVEHWIASRLAFRDGAMATHCGRLLDCSAEELAAIWRSMFNAHHAEVRQYFANETKQLLEFDIETGNPGAIRDFLSDDYRIDPAHWKKINAGMASTAGPRQRRMAARASGGLWTRLARRQNHG